MKKNLLIAFALGSMFFIEANGMNRDREAEYRKNIETCFSDFYGKDDGLKLYNEFSKNQDNYEAIMDLYRTPRGADDTKNKRIVSFLVSQLQPEGQYRPDVNQMEEIKKRLSEVEFENYRNYRFLKILRRGGIEKKILDEDTLAQYNNLLNLEEQRDSLKREKENIQWDISMGNDKHRGLKSSVREAENTYTRIQKDIQKMEEEKEKKMLAKAEKVRPLKADIDFINSSIKRNASRWAALRIENIKEDLSLRKYKIIDWKYGLKEKAEKLLQTEDGQTAVEEKYNSWVNDMSNVDEAALISENLEEIYKNEKMEKDKKDELTDQEEAKIEKDVAAFIKSSDSEQIRAKIREGIEKYYKEDKIREFAEDLVKENLDNLIDGFIDGAMKSDEVLQLASLGDSNQLATKIRESLVLSLKNSTDLSGYIDESRLDRWVDDVVQY